MNWGGVTISQVKVTARRWAAEFTVIFAVWTVTGLLMAAQWYLLARESHIPLAWRDALIPSLANQWIYALLTPGVLWLTARFPFTGGRWWRSVPWHVLGALGFLVVWVGLRPPVFPEFDPSTGTMMCKPIQYPEMLLDDACYACWMYSTIVAVSELWKYYRQYRERELRASRLEAELAQAKLKVLRMHMDPQFLFATLRSISSLIHRDVEAADDLVASLSTWLRASLDSREEQEVSLRRELEFLNAYLEVWRIRCQDRLKIGKAVDPQALDGLVPNMILPALAEIAMQRAGESNESGREIEIRCEVGDGKLRIEIHDDLPCRAGEREWWLDSDPGLFNVETRLRHLYGGAYSLKLEAKRSGGSRLALEVPFRPQAELAADPSFAEPVFEET